MNKKITNIIAISAILCVVSSSIVMAANISKKRTTSPITHTESKPMYKNNKDADKSALKSEVDIRKKIDKEQAKTKNSHVKSVTMKTWDNHIKEDDPSDNSTFNNDIQSDHLVWVVTTEYPDGLNTRAGFYANATLTSVFDSATGNLIKSKVTGDCQDEGDN